MNDFNREARRAWRTMQEIRHQEDLDHARTRKLLPAAIAIIGPLGLAIVLFIILGIRSCAHAGEIPKTREYSTVEVCDAIYRAEGGAKAQYLYGIRSVKYVSVTEAQEICMRTVRHARKDYRNRNIKEGFIEFLSRRYCPIGAKNDPHGLNKNWVKNVKWFIKHKNN